METDGEPSQQPAPPAGGALSGSAARPSPMNSMSLYERQAVQALQALQRQPNAAQYFQQLMLQQQINNAQLHSLQQAGLAAGRQSSPSSSSSPLTTTSSSVPVSGGGAITSSRPIGQGPSATSTISQSVVLSGTAGRQGQMYLRVNRSLRAPISSQLIFMPGNTATVATVTQQPQAQQQPIKEVMATSSFGIQSDNNQVQNLALRGPSDPKGPGVKTETFEKIDSVPHGGAQPLPQPPIKPLPPPLPHIKIPSYPQPAHLKAHPPPSPSIPLSQLLLHGPRSVSTVTATATATHLLVPPPPPHGYQATLKPGAGVLKPGTGAQTLVVQPLQKASLGPEKPLPIQSKGPQGVRPPLQLPSRTPPPIRPAPAPPSSLATPPAAPPHIPVQIVGARQSSLGSSLAQARGGGPGARGGAGGPLLTVVAAIASREGGVTACRGAGLKALQSPQEVAPLARVTHVHPQANQSGGRGQNGVLTPGSSSSSQPVGASSSSSSALPPPSSSSQLRPSATLPQAPGDQRGALPGVTANGSAAGGHGTQGRQTTGSLKRKSESSSANGEEGPAPARLQPIRDLPSALSTAAVEAGPGLNPPAPSLPLSITRVGVGQLEKAPPPQAVVKPQVLTHLIEGFVIQEGAEPFPVCGPVKEPAGEGLTSDFPDVNSQSDTVTTATVLKCEYCGSLAPARQFRGTRRFCSMSCAKRYNVSFRLKHSQGHGQGQGRHHHPQGHHSDGEGVVARRRVPHRTSSEIASARIAGRALPAQCRSESSQSDDGSSIDEEEDDEDEDEEDEQDEPMSLSPANSPSCTQAPPPPPLPLDSPASPAHWSVEEVSQFISSLQGCEELSSHFLSQEIDGQALLLLREEHLMSTMNIKLGPALKICAHINTLRD
ncbi:polyhomeotic-like protein 1 [Gadus morhua]|uniref:polyhomeotic-like protein 1 n=1 Tax=Gadus morhua TaxID=8049 RepID=UPI0011B655EF|nr:polyhomeotic-like protein 1 [Gadus morhua]XP_030203621.1 polyhomeotic-like protein 1 [Gadus morhua]